MNCSGSDLSALYVGADGITINLNGFTIVGSSCCQPGGVDNTGGWPSDAPGSGGVSGPGAGFNSVTVENGVVMDANEGVDYFRTSGGTIQNMTLQSNGDGIEYTDSTSGTITKVTAGFKSGGVVHGNDSIGIELNDNHQVTVSSSTANWNGTAGILDDNSLDTLNGNKTNHNFGWGVFVESPLRVPGTSTMYLIENSTASSNGDSGFKIDNNTPTTTNQAKVVGNTANSNGTNGNSSDGWGYFADQQVVSNTTNKANLNNFSGTCFHVKCTAT
jgi:hypothetical protein